MSREKKASKEQRAGHWLECRMTFSGSGFKAASQKLITLVLSLSFCIGYLFGQPLHPRCEYLND
jgi:hypothetical protein